MLTDHVCSRARVAGSQGHVRSRPVSPAPSGPSGVSPGAGATLSQDVTERQGRVTLLSGRRRSPSLRSQRRVGELDTGGEGACSPRRGAHCAVNTGRPELLGSSPGVGSGAGTPQVLDVWGAPDGLGKQWLPPPRRDRALPRLRGSVIQAAGRNTDESEEGGEASRPERLP